MNKPIEVLKIQALPMKMWINVLLVTKKLRTGTNKNTKKRKGRASRTALNENKRTAVPLAQALTMKPIKVLLTLIEKRVQDQQNQVTFLHHMKSHSSDTEHQEVRNQPKPWIETSLHRCRFTIQISLHDISNTITLIIFLQDVYLNIFQNYYL